MPIISRTERQTTVNATPQPYSTGDRGAIGRGISALGNAIGGLGAEAEKQADFDYKMKLSDFMYQEKKALDEGIANYKGDGKDFASTWEQGYEQRAAAFAQQFSGRVGQRAQLDTRQYRNTGGMQALNAQQAFITQNNVALLEAHAARVGTTIDGSTESVQKALKALDDAIEGMPGITPRMRNAARSKAADAMWKHWASRATPEQMEQALGEFEKGVDRWREGYSSQPMDYGDVAPGARAVRRDVQMDGRTAAVRYNNPGAQYPSQAAEKFGMTGYGIIGGGHKIALFPSDVHGGAANMDNFARNYRGLTFQQAVEKWRGGNGSLNVPEGFKPSDRIDDAFLGDKSKMVTFFDAMSRHEGRGSAGPVSRDTWGKAFEMYQAGGVDGAKASAPVADKSPRGVDPETGEPALVTARERDRLALPERATMGDHAINEFQSHVPKMRKIIETERQRRAAVEWVGGVMAGSIQFNKFDGEGRKLIDQMVDASGVGQKIYEGDPLAAASASQLALKMQYTPKSVWNALRGLTESQDGKKQALGWTVINNMIATNPNIFGENPDADGVTRKAEHLRVLASQHGMEKALKLQAEAASPEGKRLREAAKKDADKFLKPYAEMKEATKKIASEMGPSWFQFWSSSPDAGASGKQRAAMVADYKDLLRLHYEATGDEDQAKAFALHDFKKKHGGSSVTGRKTIMPYPPERFYNPVGGSHDYIKKDLESSVGTYVPDVKKETITLIADKRTEQEAASGAPSYMVQAMGKDGRVHVLPGRFRPDLKAAQEEVGKTFAGERAKALKKRQEQRDNPPPPLGDIGVP